MIQNAIFGILFLKLLFRVHNFFAFGQMYQRTSSEFLFNFRFCSRKSQSQQKLAKNITHFTIQFRSKNPTHFTNLYSLDIENNMLSHYSQKLFWLQSFPADMFLLGVREKICPAPSLDAKELCIFEVIWKQMSAYFCISP